MKASLEKKVFFAFLVGIIVVVITSAFSVFLYTRQNNGRMNANLMLYTTRFVEAVSRRTLQNFILKSSEKDFSFERANLELEIAPRLERLRTIALIMEQGGEISIDRETQHFPPLPETYKKEIKEINLLVNAYFNVHKKVFSEEKKSREERLVLLTSIINRLSNKCKIIHQSVERQYFRDRLFLIVWFSLLVSCAFIAFIFIYRIVMKNVLYPLSEIMHVTDAAAKGNLSMHIDFDNYKHCKQIKSCEKKECPAYDNTNTPCWNLENTLCEELSEGGNKLQQCENCEVYTSSIHNEMDGLIASINNMILTMRNLVIEVGKIVDELSTNSEALEQISERIANDSESQAATFEQTTSSHEELI